MMAQNLNLLLAFLAGVLSFLSPCVLPLIPSYLSLVGGAAFDEQRRDGRSGRWQVFLRTLLFVAGFSVVFIVLGILFSGAGGFLTGASRVVNLVSGALVVLLGLNFIFNFWKFLNFEKKVHMSSAPRGLLGSLALGMAFGAGWTPCVGPILASILFLAGSGGQVLQGGALLAVYSLGLGLPFLLAGLFFSQFMRQRDRFKAHFRALRIASGSFLVFIGLLILSGRLQRLNIALFRLAAGLSSWQQAHPQQVRLLFAGLLAVPGLLFLAFFLVELFRPAGLRTAEPQPAGLRTAEPQPAGLRPAEPARRRRLVLRPSLALLFLALAGLTFAGTLNPAGFLAFWLAYQGI